jgi:small redox-active disulfide protein 2
VLKGDLRMKIEVLGTGCKSCENLYQAAMEAVAEFGSEKNIMVEKVSDIMYFAKMGVFMTPGLVIDGKVISSGKTMSADQIRAKIKESL